MLIGLVGPKSSGKKILAEILVQHYGFEQLEIGVTQVDIGGEQESSEHNKEEEDKCEEKSLERLRKYAEKNWRRNIVIYPFVNMNQVNMCRRPYFMLVSVDAPVLVRYKRWQEKKNGSLESFICEDDQLLYNVNPQENQKKTQVRICMDSADVFLFNDGTRESIKEKIEKIKLTNRERLRPSWDNYFIQLAFLASKRSNCMKRRVGCVLVKDNIVIATGYNGTPRGLTNCNDGGCERCNANTPRGHGLDYCLCLHSEENALLEAGRERATGTVLYCTTCPCSFCAKKIIQLGVKRVVYSLDYGMDQITQSLFKQAHIELVKFEMLTSLELNDT